MYYCKLNVKSMIYWLISNLLIKWKKFYTTDSPPPLSNPTQTHLTLSSTIEPTCFEEANKDEFWNKAMDEEMDQIEKNDTWELVPRLKDKNVIGTKWVYSNKLNKDG